MTPSFNVFINISRHSRCFSVYSSHQNSVFCEDKADINEILSFRASGDNVSATVLLNMTWRAINSVSFLFGSLIQTDAAVIRVYFETA